MITQIKIRDVISLLSLSIVALASCKKEASDQASIDTAGIESGVIAIAASASSAIASEDSVYVLQTCAKGSKRDSVAQSSLPASITAYLADNYSGNTFHKAFAIKDSLGTITGYVVIFYYNDNPVAIQFTSSGSFVKVLEQREKGDLSGRGWHHGGRFEDREGKQKDTVAINALPATIQSYLSANYGSDTLLKACKNRDSSYMVLSKNNGLFVTGFSASGTFVNRLELPAKPGKAQEIAAASLPANVLSYLETTYPNYVFKKAFSIAENNVTRGFLMLLDANNTRYAVAFEASGNFLKAKTIH